MHGTSVVVTVIAVVALLLVSATAAIGLRRLNLPYTVGLVIVGLVLGIVADRVAVLAPLEAITLSPELVLFVFLPTLIFESAYNLDSRLLVKNLTPVLLLAAPGLVISTAVVGLTLALTTSLSLKSALVFGALISATDPVAVIALFKDVGAPKRLQILVEGESLFNDATAIVLFRLILISAGTVTLATIAGGVGEFAFVFFGGLGVGALIGYAMMRSIVFARDDSLVQVALSTVVAYAAFVAADHYLHVSGVMATLGAGLVIGILGSTRFTREVRAYLRRFWEFAAFVANSLIFLLVGMAARPVTMASAVGPIIWAVIAVIAARAVAVYGLLPIVGRVRGSEPIGWKYRMVLVWGGLRGAVALALVLSLPAEFPQRDLMTSLALAVVLFTLVSGGLTIKPLIHALGLDRPGVVERLARVQAALSAKREALGRLEHLVAEDDATGAAAVARPYREAITMLEQELATLRQECSAIEIGEVLWSEALSAEQRAYRDLFERGAIGEPVLHELDLSVELARDGLKRGQVPAALSTAMPIEARFADWRLRMVERLVPRSAIVERRRRQAVAARYEHDAALLDVSRRVAREVRELAGLREIGPEAADRCRAVYDERARQAMARIDATAARFPEYARAAREQRARRIALDAEADAIEQLEALGLLPGGVARDARGAIAKEQRDLARQSLSTRPEE